MNSCSRCNGRMIRDRDYFGLYDHCIMCGNYIYYTPKIVVPPELYGHRTPGRRKGMNNVEIQLRREQQDAV